MTTKGPYTSTFVLDQPRVEEPKGKSPCKGLPSHPVASPRTNLSAASKGKEEQVFEARHSHLQQAQAFKCTLTSEDVKCTLPSGHTPRLSQRAWYRCVAKMPLGPVGQTLQFYRAARKAGQGTQSPAPGCPQLLSRKSCNQLAAARGNQGPAQCHAYI
mmetsp:Transcript_33570/g.82510  ORF Transcript_33570/g.82510 Transcript_33570/m.82510 type:complete len:158 (+) Transcript_33570:711-1184(+)